MRLLDSPVDIGRQMGILAVRCQMLYWIERMHDFFVSYRRLDSADFAKRLAESLRSLKYDVWLDERELHPGEPIEETIFSAAENCIAGLLVFSPGYFDGWSNKEKEYFINVKDRRKIAIIPVYYGIDEAFVRNVDPRLATILGIPASPSDPHAALDVANRAAASISKDTKRSRLFEFFFKAVRQHVSDPDLDLWIALFDNDTEKLTAALNSGADPNLTDNSLYNRYAKDYATKCFDEWRRLYLFLNEK